MIRALLTMILIVLPLHAVAAEQLTSREEQLFRVCKSVGDDQVERCKARQLSRAKASWGMSNPKRAYNLYDKIDLGGAYQRDQAKQNRIRRLAKQRAATRKTFREYQPVVNDLNLQRRSYIAEFAKRRLACHLAPHGRQRSICFDEYKNWASRTMQEQRGSVQYPAR